MRDRRPLHGTARLAGLRVYASSRGLCWVSGLRVAQPRPSNSCHLRVFTQRGLGTEATNCSPRAKSPEAQEAQEACAHNCTCRPDTLPSCAIMRHANVERDASTAVEAVVGRGWAWWGVVGCAHPQCTVWLQARALHFLGYNKPFDRHDWTLQVPAAMAAGRTHELPSAVCACGAVRLRSDLAPTLIWMGLDCS